MIKVLMFVPWVVDRVEKFDPTIRNANQLVMGERYWFSKYWPHNVSLDVVGVRESQQQLSLKNTVNVWLYQQEILKKIGDYDVLITHDWSSALSFAFGRSKFGIHKSIPHVLIDVGLPRALERVSNNIPTQVNCALLKQVFNKKSVSHIIFHSICQRSFYKQILGFSDKSLTYVPFGVEVDYFKPCKSSHMKYLFAAGEYRDYETLLRVYRQFYSSLPELRIRSGLMKPSNLPPNVSWMPRSSISIFKEEALNSQFVIVPLHSTLRSTGLMTCLQSMALGKLVLAPKVQSIKGYITDWETGIYYEPYNPSDLYKKILYILENSAIIEKIGLQARKQVVSNFDLQSMSKNLWSTISNVLKTN
jgi:glycosyltransferase involved in cell wall biosynthesis